MTDHFVHGIQIASAVPLPEPADRRRPVPDLVVEDGGVASVDAFDSGEVMLQFRNSDRVLYEASRMRAGWRVQAPGYVGFDVQHGRIEAFRAETASPEMVPLLLAGTGLAFALEMQGELCLHASAVELDGGVVAFTGPSGMGKTTLAALAAAGGLPFFADDLLRISFGADALLAHRGSTEARLRPKAASQDAFATRAGRPTVDGRVAQAIARSDLLAGPITAIALPRPDESRTEVEVVPLSPGAAMLALLPCLRLTGWLDAAVVERHFEQLTDIAAAVPVVEVWLPWGRVPSPGLVADLVQRLHALDRR